MATQDEPRSRVVGFWRSRVSARKAGRERMVFSYLQEAAEKHKRPKSEFEKVLGGRNSVGKIINSTQARTEGEERGNRLYVPEPTAPGKSTPPVFKGTQQARGRSCRCVSKRAEKLGRKWEGKLGAVLWDCGQLQW